MMTSKFSVPTTKLKALIGLIFLLNYCYASVESRKKVLLLVIDGFRWDYMTYQDTPNLDRVVSRGAKSHHMDGVFPSETIPSMYAMATGLYPGSSGVIGNKMYDLELNSSIDFLEIFESDFNYAQDTSGWYLFGEPIWVTAAKNGLKSASYFWPGTEATIHGYRPNFAIRYSEKYSLNDQVDQTINWFVQDDVDLVLLYFSQPDLVAHDTGPAPQSKQTLNIIKNCDNAMGYLLKQLESHSLLDTVNMVVVSDHGFTSLPVPNKLVTIDDYVQTEDIQSLMVDTIIGNILPAEGQTYKVYNLLKNAHPNMTVYKKEDIPERFHYKDSPRVLPIVVMPDPGWLLRATASQYNRTMGGTHGYDNELMSMKPIFMAMGPDIKQGFTSPVVRQVDIYSLLCKLLQITPAVNNGTLDIIGMVLNQSQATKIDRKPLTEL